MGLMVLQTTPIQMTFMGLPVTAALGKGVRTGDDTPILGLMDWLHPDRFSSLIIYDVTPARAQRIMNRANNQGGLSVADGDNSWLSLIVTPLALQTALVALGLITPPP